MRLIKLSYMVFLLIGVIFVASGIATYHRANLSTEYNIPKGATWIGIGPFGNMTPIRTRMIFSVPYNEINLEVSFSFTEFKKYHIYIMMPYETLQASPYVIYQSYCYFEEEMSRIGNVSAHFKNFAEKGSSIINATFIPNTDFHFTPSEPVTLSIHATVSGLVSINYPLSSKQTVIMTFFGSTIGVRDDAMAPYIGINNHAMNDYPFQVIVQFPKESYLSSDTYPSPIELFVTESYRSTLFNLDFSYPEGYAQSISCSYNNPQQETYRNFLTFFSGVMLTTGIAFCLQPLWDVVRRVAEKKKTSDEEKPKGQGEETEEPYDETIIRLIRLVDRSFKFNWVDVLLRDDNTLPFGSFIFVFILVVIFLLIAPLDPYQKLMAALAFVSFMVAYFSLMVRSIEARRHIIKVNFKRIGTCVEKNDKPLLKALIKMKVKNQEFGLEQIYNMNKSMFSKEKLLERL